jgi:hypothetical protein
MNKLWDRLYTGIGVISMGGVLAASLGSALIYGASHPVDTYRDIRKCRAGTQSPASESNILPRQRPDDIHDTSGPEFCVDESAES